MLNNSSLILDLIAVAPEIMMLLSALLLLMAGAFSGDFYMANIRKAAIILLITVLLLLVFMANDSVYAFYHAFYDDVFTKFMKFLVVAGTIVALIMSRDFFENAKIEIYEFPILVVLACTGMMLMISANDLILLYLALELQSLSLYILTVIKRGGLRSSEAGVKYFVLGALSSGMLLYGSSLIYGFTGSTNFQDIARVVAMEHNNIGLLFGLVFLMAGIIFKISLAPFHMWTPDVYEGAQTPITAYFAAVPKVAAIALLVRVLYEAFPHSVDKWQQIIIFVALLSILVGGVAGIGQKNIKRLMAYSSIGHMGYAMVGLAAGSQMGVRSLLIYIVIYVIMTLGVFAVILSMKTKDGPTENIHDLAGLSKSRPMMAFMLAVLMFSLAGIPPLGGFFGKFYVFMAAVESDLFFLAIFGIMGSVIAAVYYLRIIKIMYFDTSQDIEFENSPFELRVIQNVSAILMLFTFFLLPYLQDHINLVTQSFK